MQGDWDIVEAIEALRGLLMDRAGGNDQVDRIRYERTRAELMVIPEVRERLPRFVRDCDTLDGFWGFIKAPPVDTRRGLRAARRRYIDERFSPILKWAREGGSPTTGRASAPMDRDGFYNLLGTRSEVGPSGLRRQEIVVLGPDGATGLPRLREIQAELASLGYPSHLLKELPEDPEQSNSQKLRMWALAAPFAIMEDSSPAGQIAEFELCKQCEVVTAVLRERGRGSTWMIGPDNSLSYPFVKFFEYNPPSLSVAIGAAVAWAKEVLAQRRIEYGRYPWRERSS